jgi:hypothetical protein
MICSDCHTIYPKLTPLGRRFKEDGYRLPDDESSWRKLLRSFPGSVRTRFQSPFMTAKRRQTDKVGPLVGSFKPVTAGSVSSWLSFWVDWPIDVSTEELEKTRQAHYWVRINDTLRILRPDLLHVKAGQFELDLPFTQSRTYNLFPYDPYLLNGIYQESLVAPRRGVELSGAFGKGFRYSLAVADTLERPLSESDATSVTIEDPFDPDLYLRVSKTFRNAHRLGLFFYRADNVIAIRAVDEAYLSPFPFDFTFLNKTVLLGADVDWYSGDQRFNVYGLFLLGRKDLESEPFEEFRGGFAQLDTRLLDSLILVARYSWTDTLNKWAIRFDELPLSSSRREQNVAIGFQWWILERLRVGLEYRIFSKKPYAPRGAFALDFTL